MKTFTVMYSARKVGAIGIFLPVRVVVAAATEESAKQAAFDQLHVEGYETNHCISTTLCETTHQFATEYAMVM